MPANLENSAVAMLQKYNYWETKHRTWRVGELRFSKPAVPDELPLWSSGSLNLGWALLL